jgi:ATP-binding cassette, subfamily B, bacterial
VSGDTLDLRVKTRGPGISSAEETTSSDGWRLVRGQLRLRWKGLVLGVSVGLIWTVAKVSVPTLVKWAIDRGIEKNDMAAIRRWAIAIALAGVVSASFTGLRRYVAFREARYAEADLRDRMFAHIMRLHFGFHDRSQTGQLMSRANSDLQQIQNFIVLIPLTISNFVTVAAVAVILARIDLTLTILALGSLPVVNWMAKRFSSRLHPLMLGVQQESAELAGVVEETVSGVRVVKGFGAEDVQRARLRTEADDLYEVSMSTARLRSVYWPALELLPNLGLIAVLGYGGHQVLDGNLLIGSLVAFNAYVALLVWPLRMLGMIIAQAQRAVAAGQRVHEVLSTEPQIVDPPKPEALPDGGGHVRFEDVSFGYAPGRRVLDHLDLELRAGESVALVGATGGGKSTIARLMARFYDVDGGRISIDGVDVRDLRVLDVRRSVGLVFEDTFLFSDSIASNIAFAIPDAPHETIERAARLAGAHEFISNLPEGYDTEIGERGFSLSGGQRQRIAIARAILADPRILILDDATSAVDPTKEYEIRDALAEVMTGRTTLVIAHRPATIALADRVVLLDEGRIVADGTHGELLAGSERYREVLASIAAKDAETAAAASTTDDPSELLDLEGVD